MTGASGAANSCRSWTHENGGGNFAAAPGSYLFMEHRWGMRFAVDYPARLRDGTRLVGVGRVRDLSVSGGFVVTTVPLAADTPVRVEMRTGTEQLELDGFVVRYDPAGIAVEWTELSPGLVEALGARGAAEDPAPSRTDGSPDGTSSLPASLH